MREIVLVPVADGLRCSADTCTFSKEVLDLQAELGATPAGKHVHAIYAKHRMRPSISPVSGPRDDWTLTLPAKVLVLGGFMATLFGAAAAVKFWL